MYESTDNAILLEPEIAWWGLGLVFVTPALGGFVYGYDLGATSFVLSMLQQQENDSHWWHDFGQHQVQQGLFVSALSLGALLGSHWVLFYLANRIGRRCEIRVSAVLYILGTCFNIASGTILAKSSSVGFACLLAGRLLYGMGVGFTMHGAPTYMAEMCPARVRGAVVSAKEMVIVLGIVVGYCSGNLLSSLRDADQWSDLYAVSMIATFPMLLLTYCIPRSKRWLLLHGLRQEARESMKFVYNGDITHAFDLMAQQIEANHGIIVTPDDDCSHDSQDIETMITSSTHSQDSNDASYDSISSKSPSSSSAPLSSIWTHHRPAFVASMGLILFQQCSGQPSVISYATVLFESMGWSGNASVLTSVFMLMNSLCTVLLVDKVGRKRLLHSCCIIMGTAAVLLCVCFGMWQASNESYRDEESADILLSVFFQWTILFAMFAYIGGYQIGFGPITWVLAAEVFPLEMRGTAMALGVEWNYLLNFAVQFMVPIVVDKIGWASTFGGFGVILAMAYWFVAWHVPETKGLSLEEIEVQMKKTTAVVDEQTHLLKQQLPPI